MVRSRAARLSRWRRGPHPLAIRWFVWFLSYGSYRIMVPIVLRACTRRAKKRAHHHLESSMRSQARRTVRKGCPWNWTDILLQIGDSMVPAMHLRIDSSSINCVSRSMTVREFFAFVVLQKLEQKLTHTVNDFMTAASMFEAKELILHLYYNLSFLSTS